MEEGGNLARTIPTSNPDPDQEQGGLGVWCGVNRQRAERSRALGPVRPTSDATRAANAAQPTARRRRQRRRPTHPRNTHERAATSDATNTTTTSSRCRCHGTAARLRGGRTHEECSAGGALQAGAIEKVPHIPSKLHQHRPHRPSSQTGCTRIKEVLEPSSAKLKKIPKTEAPAWVWGACCCALPLCRRRGQHARPILTFFFFAH